MTDYLTDKPGDVSEAKEAITAEQAIIKFAELLHQPTDNGNTKVFFVFFFFFSIFFFFFGEAFFFFHVLLSNGSFFSHTQKVWMEPYENKKKTTKKKNVAKRMHTMFKGHFMCI